MNDDNEVNDDDNEDEHHHHHTQQQQRHGMSTRNVSIGEHETTTNFGRQNRADAEGDDDEGEGVRERRGARRDENKQPSRQEFRRGGEAAANSRDTSRSSIAHRSTSNNKNKMRSSSSQMSHQTSSTTVGGASSVAAAMLGVAPGFEAAVQRMRKARDEYKPKFEESLRGGNVAPPPLSYHQHHDETAPPPQCMRHVDPSTASPLSTRRSHNGESSLSTPRPATEVAAFHFRTDERSTERQWSKPLLFVDVDLPHGRTGRIGVHRGDQAMDLAKSFCTSYGLDHDTMYRLTDILQDKIDAVLVERTRSLWV